MNISSLTTHTLNIQTNYKLPKIDPNTPLQQIKQGEHIDSNYYKSHYGDINYYTKTYTKTKEESLDNFMVSQTLSILNGFLYKTTFGFSDILVAEDVFKTRRGTYIEDCYYPTFDNGYFMEADYYEYYQIPHETYLNSYANSNLINTKFGKAEIFLDLADNDGIFSKNTQLFYFDSDGNGFVDENDTYVGTLSKNAQLFRFDSDGNGYVDKNDMYFDKLKIRAYDKDGNKIIKKLGDVVDSIDLKEFIDSKENAIKKVKATKDNYKDMDIYERCLQRVKDYNPYHMFKAEVRYESMNDDDIKELAKLADKDGWIQIKPKRNADGEYYGLTGLAYAKQGVDGNYRLEELGFAIGRGRTTNFSLNNEYDILNNKVTWRDEDVDSYQNQQYTRFINLYNDYMNEINNKNKYLSTLDDETRAKYQNVKSAVMLSAERDFTAATGLKFSLENLQKVKDSFEADKKATANMLIDTDSLTAIRINENGTFTLRFNSGREINVSKLYKDSGKAFNEALNVNADFMDEKELNEKIDLSVSVVKIKNENTGKLEEKSLKDLGVELIQKTTNGKLFILRTKEGKSIVVNQIYTKTQNEPQNNQNAQNAIDEKEKFYPKPLKIWA
mgnify:FL=1